MEKKTSVGWLLAAEDYYWKKCLTSAKMSPSSESCNGVMHFSEGKLGQRYINMASAAVSASDIP